MTTKYALLATELRRRRKQLDLTLTDVTKALYGEGRVVSLRPMVSRFERGLGNLPGGKTPTDYERMLDRFARAQQKADARLLRRATS
jgi:hypothetical protein